MLLCRCELSLPVQRAQPEPSRDRALPGRTSPVSLTWPACTPALTVINPIQIAVVVRRSFTT